MNILGMITGITIGFRSGDVARAQETLAEMASRCDAGKGSKVFMAMGDPNKMELCSWENHRFLVDFPAV